MKKVFAFLLATMLLVSMTACGTTSSQKEPEAYVPSSEIEVALAFVDEEATVLTRRLVEKELKEIELACVYYTQSGFQIGTYELVECTFSTQDTLSIWNFDVPGGCVYMEATIASVTYPDGTKNTCPGVYTWGESKSVLDLKAYDRKVQEMKKLHGAAAENCPAAAITLGVLEEGKQKLEITAGEQAIKDMMLYTLWYDEAGAPVDCDGVFVKNAENITSGEMEAKETATYSIEAPAGAAKAKIIIRKATYADDTVWENAYFYEWAFVNYSAFE